MTPLRLVPAAVLAAIGVAACGADGSREGSDASARTSAAATSTSAPGSGDAILIETLITDARSHTGEVLTTSVIGEAAFCPGGTTGGLRRNGRRIAR